MPDEESNDSLGAPPSPNDANEEANSDTAESKPTSVTWTASEFITHDKSTAWYVNLAVAAIVFSALIFILFRDIVSVAVIIVAAIIFGVYGAKKPRQLEYKVDQRGLTIGNKFFPYDKFNSFSVVPEGALLGITFMPLKRFSPLLTIYFAPEDEEKIVGVLSAHIPYEEPSRDMVDTLMRHVRF
jgi:hypothetical protein